MKNSDAFHRATLYLLATGGARTAFYTPAPAISCSRIPWAAVSVIPVATSHPEGSRMIRNGTKTENLTTNRIAGDRANGRDANGIARLEVKITNGSAPSLNGRFQNGAAEPPPAPVATGRTCPTRVSQSPVLIAHNISTSECNKRQREMYHKCWDCQHAHRTAGLRPMPAPSESAGNTNGHVNGPTNGAAAKAANGLPKIIH